MKNHRHSSESNSSKKSAIITGASGDIGSSVALALSKNGYDIFLQYHSKEEEARKLGKEIIKAGGRVASLKLDFCAEGSINKIFEAYDKAFSNLKLLVNCAACFNGRKKFDQISYNELNTVFRVNYFAPFMLCQQASLRMKRKNASIINISSQAATFGGDQISPYASSKSALNTMTISLARELAALGIRVNAISPGIIDTKMHGHLSEDKKLELSRTVPLGRLGSKEDIANAVLWLASNQAEYITGAIIPVSGGR